MNFRIHFSQLFFQLSFNFLNIFFQTCRNSLPSERMNVGISMSKQLDKFCVFCLRETQIVLNYNTQNLLAQFCLSHDALNWPVVRTIFCELNHLSNFRWTVDVIRSSFLVFYASVKMLFQESCWLIWIMIEMSNWILTMLAHNMRRSLNCIDGFIKFSPQFRSFLSFECKFKTRGFVLFINHDSKIYKKPLTEACREQSCL